MLLHLLVLLVLAVGGGAFDLEPPADRIVLVDAELGDAAEDDLLPALTAIDEPIRFRSVAHVIEDAPRSRDSGRVFRPPRA